MAGFFGFLDYSKPGRGVGKDEPEKTGLILYFSIFSKRIWKIMALNLFYIVASIPAIIIAFFLSSYFMGVLFTFSGIEINNELSSAVAILYLLFTVIILQITGSGPASVAMNYVLRKYVNDTHSWVWSDFIDNIKSNFKQGIGVYLVNVLVISLFFIGFLFYTFVMKGMLSYLLRTILLVFTAIFILMQKYTYMLVSGFELKFKHIYKNALILTIAGMKWNIFSAAVVLALMYGAYSLLMRIPFIGILVFILLYFSVITFTQIFITNNVVKKYLLKPIETQNSDENGTDSFETDFEDTV